MAGDGATGVTGDTGLVTGADTGPPVRLRSSAWASSPTEGQVPGCLGRGASGGRAGIVPPARDAVGHRGAARTSWKDPCDPVAVGRDLLDEPARDDDPVRPDG